jgi:predicted anti-sigma-YlaC factor YlaD
MESCRSIEEVLIFFIDGELSHKESERVRLHLHQCRRCRVECQRYKRIISLFSSWEEDSPLKEDFIEETLKKCLLTKSKETSLLKIALKIFFIRIVGPFGVRTNIIFKWR